MEKKKRGGARKNAGAKPKFNEESKYIQILVPLSHEVEVRKIIDDYLKYKPCTN